MQENKIFKNQQDFFQKFPQNYYENQYHSILMSIPLYTLISNEENISLLKMFYRSLKFQYIPKGQEYNQQCLNMCLVVVSGALMDENSGKVFGSKSVFFPASDNVLQPAETNDADFQQILSAVEDVQAISINKDELRIIQKLRIDKENLSHVFAYMKLFDKWTPSRIQRFLQEGEQIKLTKNDRVYYEDQNADSFYIIISGEFINYKLFYYGNNDKKKEYHNFEICKSYSNKKLMKVNILNQNETFGEEDILNSNKKRTFQVICDSSSGQLLKFSISKLKELMSYPDTSFYLKTRHQIKTSLLNKRVLDIQAHLNNFQNFFNTERKQGNYDRNNIQNNINNKENVILPVKSQIQDILQYKNANPGTDKQSSYSNRKSQSNCRQATDSKNHNADNKRTYKQQLQLQNYSESESSNNNNESFQSKINQTTINTNRQDLSQIEEKQEEVLNNNLETPFYSTIYQTSMGRQLQRECSKLVSHRIKKQLNKQQIQQFDEMKSNLKQKQVQSPLRDLPKQKNTTLPSYRNKLMNNIYEKIQNSKNNSSNQSSFSMTNSLNSMTPNFIDMSKIQQNVEMQRSNSTRQFSMTQRLQNAINNNKKSDLLVNSQEFNKKDEKLVSNLNSSQKCNSTQSKMVLQKQISQRNRNRVFNIQLFRSHNQQNRDKFVSINCIAADSQITDKSIEQNSSHYYSRGGMKPINSFNDRCGSSSKDDNKSFSFSNI